MILVRSEVQSHPGGCLKPGGENERALRTAGGPLLGPIFSVAQGHSRE